MNRNFIEFIKIPEGIRIPYFGGVWLRFTNFLCNKSILKEQIPDHPLNTEPRDKKIIASLTSYPKRIGISHIAIKSLMLQTVKPDKIILWLAEEQFPDRKLPEELTALCKYGLEIRWVYDMYGHKKFYFPVLEQKEDELVISYDDDIIYSRKSIERLMKTHEKFPNCVVVERGQVFDENHPDNPGRWKTNSSVGVKSPTFSLNPSPGGGCLIPYGVLHEDTTNEQKVRQLAYRYDDIWLMFMCAEKGTRFIKTRKNHRTFSVVAESQIEQIASENVANNKNAGAMKLLKAEYPLAWERISDIK